jgi:hypothetical protein
LDCSRQSAFADRRAAGSAAHRPVLDWAKAAGFRAGNNPVGEISKALPRRSDRKGHHAALPYLEVPAFVQMTAKTLGLNIPQSLLATADDVIEQGTGNCSAWVQLWQISILTGIVYEQHGSHRFAGSLLTLGRRHRGRHWP